MLSWKPSHPFVLAALLPLLLCVGPALAYPARADGMPFSYFAQGGTVMDSVSQVPTANECTLGVAQGGYALGGTNLPVTLTGSARRMIASDVGTFSGSRYGTTQYTWNAPATGTAVTFRGVCCNSRSECFAAQVTATLTNSGGGGGGQQPSTPPAKCSSITNPIAFCTSNGYGNSLIASASSTDCAADPCTAADAARCCTPATGGSSAAKCSTITNAATFCTSNGYGNSLIAAASTTDCVADTCTAADASRCCTPASGGGAGSSSASASVAVVELDPKLEARITHLAASNEVKFEIISTGGGWFGVGVSSDGSMISGGAGTDLVACDGSLGVQRYWVTSYSKPTNGVAVPGAVCSITPEGQKSIMRFTRPMAASTDTQRAVKGVGEKTNLVWAYHNEDRNSITYHGTAHRGAAAVDVTVAGRTTGDTVDTPVATAVWLHAGLMLAAWSLLLPFGALIARCNRKRKWWFKTHRFVQVTGWLIQLGGAGAIVWHKGDAHFQGEGTALLHMYIGAAVTFFGTMQPLNACIRPHPEPRTSTRACWEFVHVGSGWLAVLGGIANCGLAVWFLSVRHGWGNSLVVVATGALAVAIFVLVGYTCVKALSDGNTDDAAGSSSSGGGTVTGGRRSAKGSFRFEDEDDVEDLTVKQPAAAGAGHLTSPDGWVKQQSSSGDYYWYNQSTGESMWDTPEGVVDNDGSDGMGGSIEMVPNPVGDDSVPDLPEGWTTAISKSTGMRYYVSPSGETQWEPPAM